MNLPLMEEVTKKSQKAKVDNQAGLFAGTSQQIKRRGDGKSRAR